MEIKKDQLTAIEKGLEYHKTEGRGGELTPEFCRLYNHVFENQTEKERDTSEVTIIGIIEKTIQLFKNLQAFEKAIIEAESTFVKDCFGAEMILKVAAREIVSLLKGRADNMQNVIDMVSTKK